MCLYSIWKYMKTLMFSWSNILKKNDQQCLVCGRDYHSLASLRSYHRMHSSKGIRDTKHIR